MNTVSLTYLIFTTGLWLVVCGIASPKVKRTALLLASYFFYATFGLGFLAILIASSLLNFCLARFIARKPIASRLWVGILANVLILFLFKYVPGTIMLSMAMLHSRSWLSQLAWPAGISFWTFQAISSLFDNYREPVAVTLQEFCLYMAFWPTVISGPICRLREMLPQFRMSYRPTWSDVSLGVRRIIIGLFMKVFLAQLLANGFLPGQGLDSGFKQQAKLGGCDVWVLAIGFGFQLFFDFAGYSNIAIGVARVFGIKLRENFDDPYMAASPSIFWTRWHMSLSFWIRDYVFLPLATLRRGDSWRLFVIFFSMLIFGIWHGATLGFLFWGSYQGLLLVLHRLLQLANKRWKLYSASNVFTLLGWAATFATICLGWISFRQTSFWAALRMYQAVFSPKTYFDFNLDPNLYLEVLIMFLGYLSVEFMRRVAREIEPRPAWRTTRWLLSPMFYSALILAIVIWSQGNAAFIYFQF